MPLIMRLKTYCFCAARRAASKAIAKIVVDELLIREQAWCVGFVTCIAWNFFLQRKDEFLDTNAIIKPNIMVGLHSSDDGLQQKQHKADLRVEDVGVENNALQGQCLM